MILNDKNLSEDDAMQALANNIKASSQTYSNHLGYVSYSGVLDSLILYLSEAKQLWHK